MRNTNHANKQEITGLDPLRMLPSLDEQVYDALLEAILSCKLKPGMPLVEATVARQLGVSKTPVRAALQRLENELFVKRGESYRYCVADFSTKDVHNVYLVRSRLEGLVAFLATPHMKPDDIERASALIDGAEEALAIDDIQKCVDLGRKFHQLFLNKIDNEYLADSLRRTSAHVERGRRLAALSHPTSLHSVEQHRQILAAMSAGKPSLAEQRMQEHIMGFLGEIMVVESTIPQAEPSQQVTYATSIP